MNVFCNDLGSHLDAASLPGGQREVLPDTLSRQAAAPKYFRMRRYNGDLLAEQTQYTKKIEARYGSPLWCLHRADIQVMLAEKGMQLGVVIELGCKVECENWGENHEKAEGEMSVSIEGGEDIVLAADGIWSETRQRLLGKEVRLKPTGNLAYRILLDRDSIKADTLRAWLDSPGINIWSGTSVGYSIKGGRWLNLVLLVKGNLPEDVMKAEGDLAEMKAIFQDCNPM